MFSFLDLSGKLRIRTFCKITILLPLDRSSLNLVIYANVVFKYVVSLCEKFRIIWLLTGVDLKS